MYCLIQKRLVKPLQAPQAVLQYLSGQRIIPDGVIILEVYWKGFKYHV